MVNCLFGQPTQHRIPATRVLAFLFGLSASLLSAQTPPAAKDAAPPADTGPLIVDVHVSPYRAKAYYSQNLGHQRFDMRDATILDLIDEAYERRDETVLGGPTWIGFDRFDVAGRIDSLEPPKFSAPSADGGITQKDPRDAIRPFLKRVLEERFHLKYHTEDRPLPGYIMTVAKDGMKAPEAKDPTAPPNCRGEEDKTVPGAEIITCTSQTTAELVKSLGGVYPHQLVDRTGLTKSYDISFHANFSNIHTEEEYTRIFTDAFRQLGLIVTPGNVPQPALVVDSVERPTPNKPDIATLIPPPLDLEFEVATIKPADESDTHLDQIRPTATEITFSNFTVQGLMTRAFQFPTGAMIANRPPWFNGKRYTVLVRLPSAIDGRALWQNQDEIAIMLQKLMADRFGLKYHWGEQKLDGWVLAGGTPKMKKADPNSRTLCAWGPPDGEKDVRSTPDSPYDNEFHCQNVTMAQFADVMQAYTGSDMKYRIFDKTGLAGSWDFTLYYSSLAKLTAAAATADAKAKEAGADTTSEPVGGMSINDAIHKELGLQLVRQPETYPALVMDHIEQTPTDN
jgi:uncharacterized protein (TIGR03435 family)